MRKVVIFLVFFFTFNIASIISTSDINITCVYDFHDDTWTQIASKEKLTCDVKSDFGTERRNIVGANPPTLSKIVTLITIIDREIYKFPTGIYISTPTPVGVFITFEGILIDNSSISTLVKSDLEPFGMALLYFGLKNSKLQYITSETFEANTAIKLIDLQGNKITFIDNDSFKQGSLSDLRLLGTCGTFGKNAKSTTEIDDLNTDLNTNCATLLLRNSLLQSLIETLTQCDSEKSNLEEKIEELDKKNDDLIPTDDPCRFKDVLNEGYSCVGNKIKINDSKGQKIEWKGKHDEKKNNADVKVLVIKSQIVKFFPLEIGKFFANLTTLIIEDSQLSVIKRGDFVTLENISKISLARNLITSIASESFKKLLRLSHLDLSDNKLTQIKSNILPSPVVNDFKFYAANNKISSVENLFVWNLKKAQVINFSGNPKCDYSFSTGADFTAFYKIIMSKC